MIFPGYRDSGIYSYCFTINYGFIILLHAAVLRTEHSASISWLVYHLERLRFVTAAYLQ